MSFIIGFKPNESKKSENSKKQNDNTVRYTEPKKSLVRVYFDDRGFACSYYNDKFDLKVGDIVFVEGKMENMQGMVVEVSYSFKIKLSDYKRVIALANTEIHGKLYLTKNNFLSFDRNVIPYSKISTWYAPPLKEEDEIVSGEDDMTYPLVDDVRAFNVSPLTYDRGIDYFDEHKVKFLELDGERGKAIVEGSKGYTVEFCYKNGEISKLKCDCYCVGICKHIVATAIQLKGILKAIEENYADLYKEGGYFSMINKVTLLNTAVMRKDKGEITL